MIDWVIAKRIATFVAGTGDAEAPTVDLAALAAESESRVVSYTGLTPARFPQGRFDLGFQIGLFAAGLGQARFMTWSPEGYLVISELGTTNGRVSILIDRDHDGTACEP